MSRVEAKLLDAGLRGKGIDLTPWPLSASSEGNPGAKTLLSSLRW
jgi:hypothetical protein